MCRPWPRRLNADPSVASELKHHRDPAGQVLVDRSTRHAPFVAHARITRLWIERHEVTLDAERSLETEGFGYLPTDGDLGFDAVARGMREPQAVLDLAV